MPLTSVRFWGVPKLEACAVDDSAPLTSGSGGPFIALVEQALINLGQDLGTRGADGAYGPCTETAVIAYKSDRSIPDAAGQIGGIVGKLTIASMVSNIDAFHRQIEPCLSDPVARLVSCDFRLGEAWGSSELRITGERP